MILVCKIWKKSSKFLSPTLNRKGIERLMLQNSHTPSWSKEVIIGLSLGISTIVLMILIPYVGYIWQRHSRGRQGFGNEPQNYWFRQRRLRPPSECFHLFQAGPHSDFRRIDQENQSSSGLLSDGSIVLDYMPPDEHSRLGELQWRDQMELRNIGKRRMEVEEV
jgi:hypothetical protein